MTESMVITKMKALGYRCIKTNKEDIQAFIKNEELILIINKDSKGFKFKCKNKVTINESIAKIHHVYTPYGYNIALYNKDEVVIGIMNYFREYNIVDTTGDMKIVRGFLLIKGKRTYSGAIKDWIYDMANDKMYSLYHNTLSDLEALDKNYDIRMAGGKIYINTGNGWQVTEDFLVMAEDKWKGKIIVKGEQI